MYYIFQWIYEGPFYDFFQNLIASLGSVFNDIQFSLIGYNYIPNQGVAGDYAMFFTGVVLVIFSVVAVLLFFYVLKKIINIFC